MALDNGRADWTGTPWHQKDVPTMWSLIQHHTPDAYATHLAGWRRTSELLSQHVARMITYRDNLAASWNPDHSPAAAVYLARFDLDIDNAQRTLDASVANYAAYAAAMHVVSEAQTALRPIQAEYAANAATEENHLRTASGMAHRGGTVLATSLSNLATRQAELTGQARAVMYRASQELIEATAALQVPPAYKNFDDRLQTPPSGVNRPSIPSVKIVSPASSPSPESAITGTAAADATPTSPSAFRPTLASGPILAGTSVEQFRDMTSIQTEAAHRISSPGHTSTPPIIGRTGASEREKSPASKEVKNVRNAPQEKIIGSISGSQQASGMSSSPRPAAQANTFLPPLSGQARHEPNTIAQNALKSDQIWAVEQGIKQVLAPEDAFERIDPGPAIGLA